MASSTPRTLLAALALAAVGTPGRADPITSWPSLEAQRARPGGLFAAWSLDQRNVLAALRAFERADPDRDIAALRRRAADDPADLDTADALAARCARKGLFHQAVPLFQGILELDPTFTRSRLNLAELLRDLGSLDLADQELVAGLKREPDSQVLWRATAELRAARGDASGAAVAWKEVVRLRPDDREALLHHARAWARTGAREAAQAALGRVERAATGTHSVASVSPSAQLELGNLQRGLGDLRAAREAWEKLLNGPARGAAAVQLALLHLYRGEFREANARLGGAGTHSVASVSPEDATPPDGDAMLLAARAAIAQGLGDRDAVLSLCGQIRAVGRPRLAATLLTSLWLAEGDSAAIQAVWAAFPQGGDGAADAYRQLVTLTASTPDSRPALALKLSRAEVLKEAGWLAQAIELLEAAGGTHSVASVSPQVKSSLVVGEALALCYKAAGRRERELAVRQEVADARPDNPLASSRLVWALIDCGEWTRAEERCRDFLKRFEGDLESRVAGATIAIRKGDYATAKEDWEKIAGKHTADERPYALLLDAIVRSGQFKDGPVAIRGREGTLPTFVPGPLERAILAAGEEKWDEALTQAQRGLRLTPRDHRLWLLAGAALERKGDVGGTAARYRVAAWLRPDQPSLQETLARTASRAGMLAVAADAYRTAIGQGAPSDVQLEFADALLQWGRQDEAIAVLGAVRPASAAQREAVTLRLAEARLAKGEADQALELVQGLLAKDPGAPSAKRVARMACQAKGDLDGAIKICEAAGPGPDAASADAELGLLYLLARRYREAGEKLDSAGARATEGATRAELRQRQAIALIGQNAPEKALAVLKEIQTELSVRTGRNDDLVVLFAAVGGGAAAEALLSQIAKSDATRGGWLRGALPALAKDRALAAMVLTAYEAERSQWHGKAGELFAKAAKSAPDAALWLLEAAEAHANAGQLDAALALARQLVAACPSTAEAYLLLASVLDKQGNAEAALAEHARGAAMLGKQAVSRRRAVADRLRAGGSIEAAIAAYRALLDAAPDDLAAARALASLYAAHKPDLLAEAERLAALAVKGDPSNAAARDTLGWIHFLAKRPEAARPEILAAIALEPRNALHYYHLGMVEFVRSRKERAGRALRIALALDPKLPDAQTARSTLEAIESESPAPRP